MNDLILHPTESYPVPITICRPGQSGTRKRKAKARKARQTPTVEELRQMCKARGLKVTTKHRKGELLAMFATGVYVRPAALDREKLRRALRAQ